MCLASLATMLAVPSYSTVPFHVVWVASSITYGLRMWSIRRVTAVIATVSATTGAALTWNVTAADVHPEEITEVPMMALIFGVMVWHTERRRRAMRESERLHELERGRRAEQREFARRASHELRTPLSIARGHVEVVYHELNGRHGEDLAVALDELDRIALITKHLLALSRAQDAPLQRVPTDPLEMLTSSVTRWARTNTCNWHVSCDSPWLSVDAERMRAALDALIDNAIRFTPDGGRIEVSVALTDSHVVIEVTDSGPGIEPEQCAAVFDAFSKATPASDRRYRGTGLGLAIVRAVAESHGGTADAANKDGAGAVLSLRLPLTTVCSDEDAGGHMRANLVIEGSRSSDRRVGAGVDRRAADRPVPPPRERGSRSPLQ
ncbi:MAG: two-component system, OmpR family, sensor kinase [Frankiaceae bacterium]|nr:two-component system, OmpR family, sensor kinase [Frankiaceae bacterium]